MSVSDLVAAAKAVIPTVDGILDAATAELELDEARVAVGFGAALLAVDDTGTRLFRSYERRAMETLAAAWLETQKRSVRERMRALAAVRGWPAFVAEASRLFADFARHVQELELSLGNMRKSRGGGTFEKATLKLLRLAHVAAEAPARNVKERLGRIDIVVPSAAVALNTPDRAAFLTLKRTLRERWKQEVPQALPNQRYYLVTMDDRVSPGKADEIHEKHLIAFVPPAVKGRAELAGKSWIRSLNDLPAELRRL